MTERFRLLVVAAEFPYPPMHGLLADIWRRLQMLQRLNCDVGLVTWFDENFFHDENQLQEAFAAVTRKVAWLHAFPKRRGPRQDAFRLVRVLGGLPSHAAARSLHNDDLKTVEAAARAFNPDAVLSEGLPASHLAIALGKLLDIPMFHRSTNIEHQYFVKQSAASEDVRERLKCAFACIHLRRYEQMVMRNARVCFDISVDDLAWWAEQGVRGGQWLPPLAETVVPQSPRRIDRSERDLAFLGNLNTPNNVQGVRWLVEQVMPVVWSLRPCTMLHVGGSRPVQSVRDLMSSSAMLRLYENVGDAMDFLARSAVLLNPVLTGSGVNIKTIDMLMTERPIVTTPQGVAGLPGELKGLCEVADRPEIFAQCVIRQLEKPTVNMQDREAGRRTFGPAAVQAMLDRMRHEIFMLQDAA